MIISKKQTGEIGERIAENFLKKKGYKILDRNFFTRLALGPKTGEIDIIAEKEETISFVEVKTIEISPRGFAARGDFIPPEQKVNFQKQRKIIKTAQIWLSKNKMPLNKKWQIDVISIKIDLDLKKAEIKHFQNAFGE
ncbi:YraN family protein [Candidatus Parcubacteria bacterium]|nr:YraN family protein [Candidatus Parcubacteria bacterium]